MPGSPQDPRITRQTCNGNSNMVVDPDQFLLVRRELASGPLHGVSFSCTQDQERSPEMCISQD